MGERGIPKRTGEMEPGENDLSHSSTWLLAFAIFLSGIIHFIISLTCRFKYNWRIDDTMIQEEALGLLGATFTLFLLCRKVRNIGRIIAAYWMGYCVGLVFAMAAIATSSSREPEPLLRIVVTEIAATYCCPIAVGIAIIVGLRANRSSNVRIQKAI